MIDLKNETRKKLLLWIVLNTTIALICLSLIDSFGHRNKKISLKTLNKEKNGTKIKNEVSYEKNLAQYLFPQKTLSTATSPEITSTVQSTTISSTVGPTSTTLKPPPINYNYYHFNISLLTKCENKCKNETQLDVVYMIKSTFKRFDNRMVIRQTFGNESALPPHKIRTIFIMGIDPGDDSVRQKATEENDKYGDIVLGNFKDIDSNCSMKDMIALNWALDHCKNSRIYVTANDDAYVSTRNLLYFLNNETLYDNVKKYEQVYLPDDPMNPGQKEKYASTIGSKFLGGFLLNATVNRTGPSNVSLEENKHTMYPLYLSGHFYVMARQTVYELAVAARYVRFFRICDAYMGYITHRAGLNPVQIPGVTGNFVDANKIENFDKIISCNSTTPQKILTVYRQQKVRGNA